MDHMSHRAAMTTSLHGLGVVEYLDQDGRPTFMVDLDVEGQEKQARLKPVYYNSALLDGSMDNIVDGLVLETGTSDTSSIGYPAFKSWVLHGRVGEQEQSTLSYEGNLWSRSTLRGRWVVVSGVYMGNGFSDAAPRPAEAPAVSNAQPVAPSMQAAPARKPLRKRSRTKVPSQQSPDGNDIAGPTRLRSSVGFDWTGKNAPPKSSTYLQYVRSIEWSSTPLGPMEDWSSQLRMMCNVVVRPINTVPSLRRDQREVQAY